MTGERGPPGPMGSPGVNDTSSEQSPLDSANNHAVISPLVSLDFIGYR